MLDQEIKKLLEQELDNCTAEVELAGNHVHVQVVSTMFSGLTPVKKQQLVYGVLNSYIASGQVHAVHIKALTPEQAGQ